MSGLGGLHFGVRIVVRDPCPEHGFVHTDTDTCQKGFVADNYKEYDMGLANFSGFIIANIFDTATAGSGVQMTDTSNATHVVSANTATGTIDLGAGSGTTAPTFIDYNIQTQLASTSGLIAATVSNVITNNTTNGTFTITGTFTNSTGSNATYGNIGILVTAGGNVYLVAHDQTNGATGYVVSPLGTVAVTYTVTVS
jgi:hypothetical protein